MILAAGGINNSIVVVVLASAVIYGTPLLYGALGELLAERSGVLNLGVEGMMLVGAVMGFWAVQRTGSLLARNRGCSDRRRRDGVDPRLPRRDAAGQPDRVGPRAHDLRRGRRALVVPRQRPEPRRPAGEAFVHALPAGLMAAGGHRRADLPRPVGARVRVMGVRAPRCAVSQPLAAGAQPARRRGVARRCRRDGHQRRQVSLRAHVGGRRVCRRRRCVLLARDHAAVGRRPDGRCRLDRDRARHLRVLAADVLPRRRVLLRRVLGHPVRVPGAGDPLRRAARAVPGAPVRDDGDRARTGLDRGSPAAASAPRPPSAPRTSAKSADALSQR